MNKNIDASIVKIRNAVTAKLRVIKNVFWSDNVKSTENNSPQSLLETLGKDIEQIQN